MPVRRELLDILACPQCKSSVNFNEIWKGFVCNRCKLIYPIRDGIPVMLIEEAVRESE